MNIINVGYDSTNYYLLEIKNGKLLIDSGFPGTLPKLSAELKRKGIALSEIKYFLATHYHPDHAGLAQELKNQGVKLIVLEQQVSFITQLTEFFKTKKYPYQEIILNDNLILKCEESQKFLANLGINGEIIHTPGHSEDSVTLILDEGFAFTGDLHLFPCSLTKTQFPCKAGIKSIDTKSLEYFLVTEHKWNQCGNLEK